MLKIMLIFLILAHCGLLGWDSQDNHIWCSGQRKVAGMCYCVTLVLITISHHHPFLLLLFLLRHSEKSCWPGKACLRRSWNLPRRKILTKTPVIPYCIPSLGRDRGEQILMSDKSESAEAQDVKCQVNCLLKRYQLKILTPDRMSILSVYHLTLQFCLLLFTNSIYESKYMVLFLTVIKENTPKLMKKGRGKNVIF